MNSIARLIAAASMTVLVLAGPAAAQYPPPAPPTQVSDTTVVPGQEITVSGQQYEPGTQVVISFASTPQVLGTTTVGGDGTWSLVVTIPEDATPGQHTLFVDGTADNGQPSHVEIPITVVGAAAGGVAVTGANITIGMLILAGLIGVGAGALLLGRRRSKASI